MRTRFVSFVCAAVVAAAASAAAGPGDWQFWGKFDTPLTNLGNKAASCVRLAMDTNGNAYMGHYGDSQLQQYIVKFAPPSGTTITLPTYTRVLENYGAIGSNGALGIVSDNAGGVFYAFDTGGAGPNWLGHIKSDGTTDTAFGVSGFASTTGRRINAITLNAAGNQIQAFPLTGGAAIWGYNTDGTTGTDTLTTVTGNIRDVKLVNVGGTDYYFYNRSGNLMRANLATQTVDYGFLDPSDNPTTFTDVAGGAGFGVEYFAADNTLIYTTHDNLVTSARSTIYVINPATRKAVQTIDGLANGGQAVKPADALCYTVGNVDYMLVTQNGGNAVSVFRKGNTLAAVGDWTMY